MVTREYDVFISGAGAVGLILALHLTRLGHSVCIIDAVDKGAPGSPTYGRACMLYPRTLEILDQLDLYDDISQIGFASDRSWGYKDGAPIDRKWGFFDAPESQMHSTFFKTTLNVRSKHTEDVIRRRLAEEGVPVHAPAKLVDFRLDRAEREEYPVTATYITNGEAVDVRSKYILGCDGGGSAVRRLAGIPFEGERKLEYWVRVDGVVRTNLPEARHGLGALESSTHGHVVWVSLDSGATRIGYVLSERLLAKYGRHLSADEAVREARQAVAPFELEFERVDWHTTYGIQQHVAAGFCAGDGGRVLLAGDAAHTHSSGSAQGLNVGVQDATALSWRLAGELKGWWRRGADLLADYSRERRAVALRLIDNDRTISALAGQRKPAHLRHRPESPHVLLDQFLRRNSGFTTGLAVPYDASDLNDAAGSDLAVASAVRPGLRLPDALLQRSGLAAPKIRLYDATKNNGRFRVLVFAGSGSRPGGATDAIRALREQVDARASALVHAVDFLTVVPGLGHAFDEHLGVRRFGMAYWDPDLSAHAAYGISATDGAVLVLRPDGILGLVAPLDGLDGVMRYFERILTQQGQLGGVQRIRRWEGDDDVSGPAEQPLRFSSRL